MVKIKLDSIENWRIDPIMVGEDEHLVLISSIPDPGKGSCVGIYVDPIMTITVTPEWIDIEN